MKTNKMCLNGECTHREYYSQFVTPSIIDVVKKYIGVDRINKSTDPHLNDIKLAKWDSLVSYVYADFKSYGDSRTLSGCVCILKEAAKQIKEGLV